MLGNKAYNKTKEEKQFYDQGLLTNVMFSLIQLK